MAAKPKGKSRAGSRRGLRRVAHNVPHKRKAQAAERPPELEGESPAEAVERAEQQRRAEQHDLEGNAVAPHISLKQTELVQLRFESEHFILRTNDKELERIRGARNPEKSATRLRRKVRAKPDIEELHPGQREEETTALVAKALVS